MLRFADQMRRQTLARHRAGMAGGMSEDIIKSGKPIRFHNRCVFAILGARDALHRIGVQVLERDMSDDLIGLTLKRLYDLYTISDSLCLMGESNRLGKRVSALFRVHKIHEGRGLYAAETGFA